MVKYQNGCTVKNIGHGDLVQICGQMDCPQTTTIGAFTYSEITNYMGTKAEGYELTFFGNSHYNKLTDIPTFILVLFSVNVHSRVLWK